MEGTLLKWTNYINGWQPRYFILDGGVLSYYYSQDEINDSCKGSIKVAACDIHAHSTDPTRLDITIPGEAHYYLKAATPQDRQLWLVVLGTCKACNNSASFLVNKQGSDEIEGNVSDALRLKKSELHSYYDILTQHIYNIKVAVKNKQDPDYKLLNESRRMIGEACDSFIHSLEDCLLLVDSKHSSSSSSTYLNSNKPSDSPSSIKSFYWGSQPQPRLSSSSSASDKKCHSKSTWKDKDSIYPNFMATNPVHQQQQQQNNFSGLQNNNDNIKSNYSNNIPNATYDNKYFQNATNGNHNKRNTFYDSNDYCDALNDLPNNNLLEHPKIKNINKDFTDDDDNDYVDGKSFTKDTKTVLLPTTQQPLSISSSTSTSPSTATTSSSTTTSSSATTSSSSAAATSSSLPSSSSPPYPLYSKDTRLPTFFTNNLSSFVDIKLNEDLSIPTASFLDACRSFVDIFDKFDQTSFTPAKLDISSNIKKIHQKYVTSPNKFQTLDQIITFEMSTNQSKDSNSATQAILWLAKSLEFVKRLMEEMIKNPNEDDVQPIINEVYRDVLMNYHGWVLRSAFSIASSSAPSKSQMIRCLCLDDNHYDDPVFLNSLVRDVQDYASGLGNILKVLQQFFNSHNLSIVPDECL